MKRRCNSYKVEKAAKKSGEIWRIRLNLIEESDEGTKKYPQHLVSTNLPAKNSNLRRAYEIAEEEMNKYNCQVHSHLVEPYFDHWMNWKKETLEASTFEAYEYRIKYMRSYFQNNPITIENIDPETVKDFYQHIFNLKKRDGNHLSNRTIKDVLQLFKVIMDDAVYERIINENPCARLKIPQRPASLSSKPYIGADQIELFLQEIKGHRLEDMFVLAIYYGLRREELCALKWDAIRGDEIHIERTIVHVKTNVSKERTKTQSSYRSYPMTERVKEMFDKIKKKQEHYKQFLGAEYDDSGFIFTWEDGHPYSPDYLTKNFKKIVRRSERLDDSLTLHSLRASCVSILVHDGADIKDIQRWVGHADIKTTLQIYARTNRKQQWGVATKMDNMIFGALNS